MPPSSERRYGHTSKPAHTTQHDTLKDWKHVDAPHTLSRSGHDAPRPYTHTTVAGPVLLTPSACCALCLVVGCGVCCACVRCCVERCVSAGKRGWLRASGGKSEQDYEQEMWEALNSREQPASGRQGSKRKQSPQ